MGQANGYDKACGRECPTCGEATWYYLSEDTSPYVRVYPSGHRYISPNWNPESHKYRGEPAPKWALDRAGLGS